MVDLSFMNLSTPLLRSSLPLLAVDPIIAHCIKSPSGIEQSKHVINKINKNKEVGGRGLSIQKAILDGNRRWSFWRRNVMGLSSPFRKVLTNSRVPLSLYR